MDKKKIVFMGTPKFAVPILEMLIEKYGVDLVITQPDKKVGRKKVLTAPPVKILAEEKGIRVLQPEKISGDEDVLAELKELNPDIIIVPIAKKYDNVAKVSKLFFEDPSLKNVKAVKNKKVYFVQYKDITSTSQYMIDNIENLAKVVYQFKEW